LIKVRTKQKSVLMARGIRSAHRGWADPLRALARDIHTHTHTYITFII
jgi:hypothetical protein